MLDTIQDAKKNGRILEKGFLYRMHFYHRKINEDAANIYKPDILIPLFLHVRFISFSQSSKNT